MSKIKVTPTPAGMALLDRLEELGRSLRDGFASTDNRRRIELVVRAGFGLNFDIQAAGDEYPWQELAASTRAERRLLGYPPERPILERSGKYRESFENPHDESAYRIVRTSAAGVEIIIGSKDYRAPWLEFGTENIPAREASVLTDAAKRDLDALTHELTLDIMSRSL